MPKRGENIHKRKDGRWEGRYIKERNYLGKAKYASVYGATYQEVKSKLKYAVFDKSRENNKKAADCLFNDVLRMWMESNKIKFKGATQHKYQSMIDVHIAPYLGDIPVSKLSSAIINSYLNKKLDNGRVDGKGGLSPSYVNTMMLIIKSAIRFAVNEQMCSPLKTPICKPSLNKPEITILSRAEQSKLERYAVENPDTTALGVLISLYAGLRIGEICALKWSDIDFASRVIHVRSTVSRVRADNSGCDAKTQLIIDKPKTKASLRDIPISDYLLKTLMAARKKAISPYVVSESADFLSPRTYEYRYHRLLSKCGIKAINYHALRHTFATRCIEVGMDVKTLSEILGHTDVSITLNTYMHSSMELKRLQLEKLTFLSA